ncbi:MAG: hypothetical protein ACON5F_11820 [Jejuia sp.]
MITPSNLSVTVPPGEPIAKSNIKVQKINSQIEFSFNSSSTKPLSPLVQISFDKKGNLQVSAIVFIPTSETPNLSNINQEYVISDSGETQFDFFIIYNAPEVSSQTFQGYKVDFVLENPPKDLVQIETFIWDEDPETSRGTVTPVEKGGNNG